VEQQCPGAQPRCTSFSRKNCVALFLNFLNNAHIESKVIL
jgi:hypothetical protein